ncbi:hypothetical protein BDR22DRAFT_825040 [Usnea florida]
MIYQAALIAMTLAISSITKASPALSSTTIKPATSAAIAAVEAGISAGAAAGSQSSKAPSSAAQATSAAVAAVAAGISAGAAEARSSASATPSAPAWATAQCTTPDVTDAAINPSDRWKSVDTEDAWTAAVASWTSSPNNPLTFPQQISNFFHGPDQMLCGQTTARDGCSSDVECSDVNHPAGFFILNSLVSISDLNYNFYEGIDNANGPVVDYMGTFSTTFAPINDPDAGLKLMLDLIGLGFALMASPVWNSLLKVVPFFKANPNTLGTLKDLVNPMVSNGVTISKDAGLSGAIISATNSLDTNLGNMVTTWEHAINTYNQNLFNGSSSSINMLHSQITDGHVLEAGFQQDGIQAAMEKAIYGFLIPQAWNLSNEDLAPVVINSAAACGTSNPDSKYIYNNVAVANYACVDNTIYYLVGAQGSNRDCTDQGGEAASCSSNYLLGPLPGVSTLDGTQWGGVKVEDFIAGAVAGYKANGNKNGWPVADPTNPDTLNNIYDNGIQAAGVVQIPVCSGKEATENWDNYSSGSGKKTANYPCD